MGVYRALGCGLVCTEKCWYVNCCVPLLAGKSISAMIPMISHQNYPPDIQTPPANIKYSTAVYYTSTIPYWKYVILGGGRIFQYQEKGLNPEP